MQPALISTSPTREAWIRTSNGFGGPPEKREQQVLDILNRAKHSDALLDQDDGIFLPRLEEPGAHTQHWVAEPVEILRLVDDDIGGNTHP